MKKHVCVIGAGPAGLAAMRSLSKCKDMVEITAFELSDVVGGLWVNRDKYKHTSMYDNLRINIPKELMAYTDYPFPESETSYVHRSTVLEYHQGFATHFNLLQYIKFRHRVVEVDPYQTDEGVERWIVTARNEETGMRHNFDFDAVMVCNGHETYPYTPEIEGSKTFTGAIMHSTYHQNPKHYAGKTVVVLGAGLSGSDVSMDIHSAAKHVYLSHNLDPLTARLPANIEQVSGIARFAGDDILLRDGSVIQADIVILATGYRYHLDFLSVNCRPEIKEEHVTNLYRMMISIDHPSLYFIGLNKWTVAYKQMGVQSDLASAFITGRIEPVSRQEMIEEYEALYKRLVTDQQKRPKFFHSILDYQWEYNAILAEQSGTDQPVPAYTEKLDKHWLKVFGTSLRHFRECSYKIVSNEDFEINFEHPEVYEEP